MEQEESGSFSVEFQIGDIPFGLEADGGIAENGIDICSADIMHLSLPCKGDLIPGVCSAVGLLWQCGASI